MTQEKLKKLTINATTGEQVYEDLTDEEIEQYQIFMAQEEERRAVLEAENQAKAEAKASAISKLAALGLSEAEIQALVQ